MVQEGAKFVIYTQPNYFIHNAWLRGSRTVIDVAYNFTHRILNIN